MTSQAKRAVIDLGSNTAILAIFHAKPPLTIVREEFRVPRLAEGLKAGGDFSQTAYRRAVAALQEFVIVCREEGVKHIVCGGTAPFRRVANRERWCQRFHEETGVEIEVLSGEAEAQLSYDSAILLPLADRDLQQCKVAVVDIGGGSTEVVAGVGDKITATVSLPIGVVAYQELLRQWGMGEEGILSSAVIDKMALHLKGEIGKQLGRWDWKERELLAVAGTPVALALLEKGVFSYQPQLADGVQVKLSRLQHWLGVLAAMPTEARINEYGIPAGRADVLPVGLMILQAVLQAAGATTVTVRNAGIRFGLALRELGLLAKPLPAKPFEGS